MIHKFVFDPDFVAHLFSRIAASSDLLVGRTVLLSCPGPDKDEHKLNPQLERNYPQPGRNFPQPGAISKSVRTL